MLTDSCQRATVALDVGGASVAAEGVCGHVLITGLDAQTIIYQWWYARTKRRLSGNTTNILAFPIK
jgi:hypothetical protein